ncbi:MAG: amino acid ABC transporter permease, partial [Anaerotignaceae bacterium]
MINFQFMKETFFIALTGIPTTLLLTFVPLIIASPFALFMALSKIYNIHIVKKIVTIYVSFIRGTPLVLQILIIYSLMPSLLNELVQKMDISVNVFDINPIWYAIVVFTLNSMASLSEVFRSALLTVNNGQLEAALSIGLTPFQAYSRIIIPQALVSAIPNISNVTRGLLKGTSLAFLMTVKDITALAKIEAAYGYNYIEAYMDI